MHVQGFQSEFHHRFQICLGFGYPVPDQHSREFCVSQVLSPPPHLMMTVVASAGGVFGVVAGPLLFLLLPHFQF